MSRTACSYYKSLVHLDSYLDPGQEKTVDRENGTVLTICQMHDDVKNKKRSKSANMKTLKCQMDLRKARIRAKSPRQRTLPES